MTKPIKYKKQCQHEFVDLQIDSKFYKKCEKCGYMEKVR